MTNPFFRIDQDQTTPTLDAAMLDSAGQIVNLVGATADFKMFALGGALIFDRPATVVDAPNGHVRYAWQAGDTSTPGRYLGKFVVTYSSLDTQEFPENRYIRITVE